MTDTTAPLAVTMETVRRVELQLAVPSPRDQQPAWTSRPFLRDDLVVILALARRCLEPDGETVEAVAKYAADGNDGDPPWSERTEGNRKWWLETARAAIAALVNPDGK